MFKRVCLLTNYSIYNILRHFTEKLAEAMRRQGLDVRIIDANEKALDAEMIASIARFAPDFTCSFSSIRTVDKEGRYFWDYTQIPHVSFLVDPSLYYTRLTSSPYSIISCVDRNERNVFLESGFKHAFFWPHSVEPELAPKEGVERIYDVVYLGSCYDFESLRTSWQQRHPESFNKVLENAIEMFFSNDTMGVGEALAAAWNASGLDPAGVDFVALYCYLDAYIRGRHRVEMIRSVKDAKVHVFGEMAPDNPVGVMGWPQYLGRQSNVTLHPSVPFGEAMEILKRSKIVLNSMPFFRDGSHERIFTALACGALPVTSESKYLREQFAADKELVFYQTARMDEINGKINAWLGDEKSRQQAVGRGREKVMQHHTWDHRVKELMEILPPMLHEIKDERESGVPGVI